MPNSAYYIPNFISEFEESDLVRRIYQVPKPKWTCLSNRRLQDWGGVPHKNGMIVEPIPDWLKFFMNKITNLNIYPKENQPNHVLINEYLPGQGIMPHTDGPLFHPIITTINCGSHTILELKASNESEVNKRFKLLLEPTSLLILSDQLYTDYLHSICEIDSDEINEDIANLDSSMNQYEIGQMLKRSTRISVTIRNVPKVCKLKFFK